MLKKIVYALLKRRHFWRYADFNELSELYASTLLRMLALSLMMIFVPIFLFQQGYSFAAIFVTFGCFFVTRIFSDMLAGYIVARYGPKHTMILSCIFQIFSALLFLTVPQAHWPAWALSIPWGIAFSCYFVSFHVEFSKIKHLEHAGKEIGYMQIMEKLGAIAGPVTGGLIGSLFGPQYIFILATIVLFASLWPLFRSKEPVQTHQKLDFVNFPVAKVMPDLFAYAGLGIENTLCVNLWPLYLGVFALQGEIYAQLGGLTSAAVIASLLSAFAIGKFIDTNNGRLLLRLAATANAIVYLFRPFVQGIYAALAVNMANEAITTGYRMPFMKGMYGAADDLPGFRIVYIVSMEVFASICKATAWFVMALLALNFSHSTVINLGFVIAALASFVIMVERFKALQPKTTIVGIHA